MDADVALLQEARRPPGDVAGKVCTGPVEHWNANYWNSCWWKLQFDFLYDRWAMVVRLSDRVDVEWFKQISPIMVPGLNQFPVSGIGTVAAARVIPKDHATPPFIVASMYARWIAPHPVTGSKWRVGFPDGSAHRIISDLSAFIGNVDPSTHRILAAGDLNMVYGSKAGHDPKWDVAREHTVWDRMNVLGLEFLGPQHPNGRQADPVPPFMEPDNKNVVTFAPNKGGPEAADRQLDYVFASRGFHESIDVKAMNSVAEWGASDHCRLLMVVRQG